MHVTRGENGERTQSSWASLSRPCLPVLCPLFLGQELVPQQMELSEGRWSARDHRYGETAVKKTPCPITRPSRLQMPLLATMWHGRARPSWVSPAASAKLPLVVALGPSSSTRASGFFDLWVEFVRGPVLFASKAQFQKKMTFYSLH